MTIEHDSETPAGAGRAIAQTWEKLRPDEADPSAPARGNDGGPTPDGDRGIAGATGIGSPPEGGILRDPIAEAAPGDSESAVRGSDDEREVTLRDMSRGL